MNKIKINWIGIWDILKFKNLPKARERVIRKAKPQEVKGEWAINIKAKHLHPDYIHVAVTDIYDYPGAFAKTFVLSREDGTALPYFRAGQYISLKLQIGNSFVTRAYSLSGSPKWALEGKYAITVKENTDGFVAPFLLRELTIGTKLTISAPFGEFYYQKLRDSENVVALAGGSGITPFLSMAYALRDGIENFNLTILFGSKKEENILFKQELEDICAATDKVKVIHVLSDEEKPGFEYGFITAELIKKHAPDGASVFICGPGAMYRFLEVELKKLNLPRRLVRFEAPGVTKSVYNETDFPEKAKNQVFHITVHQGPAEYQISALSSEPILVALERAGIKAPSRCRSGECGWCRSRVIKGSFYISGKDLRRFCDKESHQIHPCVTFPTEDMVLEVPGEYWE